MVNRVGVVIVGAGLSQRMDGVDKVFALLNERPLVSFSLDCFMEIPEVAELILVVSGGNVTRAKDLINLDYPDRGWRVCIGGATRQESVFQGLNELGDVEWVIIHDAARPCVTVDLVNKGMEVVADNDAATPGLPVNDTVKVVNETGIVVSTLDRSTLQAIQTPQLFRKKLLLQAHAQPDTVATDDSSLVEALGCPVKVFPGSYDNIKVTTPNDLILAEMIIRKNLLLEGK